MECTFLLCERRPSQVVLRYTPAPALIPPTITRRFLASIVLSSIGVLCCSCSWFRRALLLIARTRDWSELADQYPEALLDNSYSLCRVGCIIGVNIGIVLYRDIDRERRPITVLQLSAQHNGHTKFGKTKAKKKPWGKHDIQNYFVDVFTNIHNVINDSTAPSFVG